MGLISPLLRNKKKTQPNLSNFGDWTKEKIDKKEEKIQVEVFVLIYLTIKDNFKLYTC